MPAEIQISKPAMVEIKLNGFEEESLGTPDAGGASSPYTSKTLEER